MALLEVIPEKLAVMVVDPTLIWEATATPWKPAEVLMVATAVSDDFQRTVAVKFAKLPSVYVPVAVYCSWLPCMILKDSGVTVMDTNTGGVTVNLAAVDLTPDKPAVTVVVPSATDVASPVVLTVATAVSDEAQATDDDMSCIDPSEKVPKAVNCCVLPRGIDGAAGVMVIDVRIAAVTERVADELTESNVAAMSVVPVLTEVASPLVAAALLIVAIAGFDEDQVAHVVKLCTVLSARVPAAVNFCVVPKAILAVIGLIAIVVTGDVARTAEPVAPL